MRALLALFEGPLGAVQFPDVSAEVLTDLADSVRARTADVARARADLAAAQAALVAAESALVAEERALDARSRKALAYARVYAQGDAGLERALAEVELPAELGGLVSPAAATHAAGSIKRGRGRPRKARVDHATGELDAMLLATANDGASGEPARFAATSAPVA